MPVRGALYLQHSLPDEGDLAAVGSMPMRGALYLQRALARTFACRRGGSMPVRGALYLQPTAGATQLSGMLTDQCLCEGLCTCNAEPWQLGHVGGDGSMPVRGALYLQQLLPVPIGVHPFQDQCQCEGLCTCNQRLRQGRPRSQGGSMPVRGALYLQLLSPRVPRADRAGINASARDFVPATALLRQGPRRGGVDQCQCEGLCTCNLGQGRPAGAAGRGSMPVRGALYLQRIRVAPVVVVHIVDQCQCEGLCTCNGPESRMPSSWRLDQCQCEGLCTCNLPMRRRRPR